MQQNIKVVLDDVDAVYEDEDGDHQAEAEPQQDIAVSPAVQGGVQHQVVRGCRQEGQDQQEMGDQPGEEQESLGQQQSQEQEEVGDETDTVCGQSCLVENVC